MRKDSRPDPQDVMRRLERLALEFDHTRVRSSEIDGVAEVGQLQGSWGSGESSADGLAMMLDPAAHVRSWVDDDGPTRLSGARPAPDLDELPDCEVKPPGRHSRARRTRLRGTVLPVMPEWVRGRLTLAPGPLAVLAIAVAALVAFTSWRLLTGGSHEAASGPPEVVAATPLLVAAPAPPGAAPLSAASASAGPAAATGSHPSSAATPTERIVGQLVVDVAGKVRRPGIAVLEPGSRVVDALKAAGGARRGVDLTPLNLARPLVDGEQILVGAPAAGSGTTGSTVNGSAVPGVTGTLVNINQADQTQLETLPGVGPVTAGAILSWRAEHGGFSSVDELLEVDGIGEATLAKLTPYVTL